VFLSFFLLRNQTQKFLSLEREGREDGSGDPLLPEQSGAQENTRGFIMIDPLENKKG